MQSLQWGDLQFFQALCDARTLSGAARRLRVEPSTVGRRLAALESAVGARLFDRTPDGYALTGPGRSMLATVAPFATQLERVTQELARPQQTLEGRVRLTVGEAFFVLFLAPLLVELRRQLPGITLEVDSSTLVRDLARREADLAIRIAPRPRQPNLVVQQLGSERFELWASREYLQQRGVPRLDQGLVNHDVVTYGMGLERLPQSVWLKKHSRNASKVFETSSMLGAAKLIEAGAGLGVLPVLLAQVSRQLERVPARVPIGRDIWLVWHEGLRDDAKVRAVAEALTTLVRRDAAVLSLSVNR